MANFKEWYANNRDKVLEKKRQRYLTDPAYRQSVIDRSASARETARASKEDPRAYGMTLQEAADYLGVTKWTLHKWRSNNYYPEPVRVNNVPVLTSTQVELLTMIRQFFVDYPKRAAAANRSKLEQVVEVVHHNWG